MSKLVSSAADPERRLQLLGQLAQQVHTAAGLHEILRFLYAQLRAAMRIDGFYVSVVSPSTGNAQPVLTIIEETEQPPEEAPQAEEPGGARAHRTTVLAPHRATEHLPQSQIVCAVRGDGRTLGHLTVTACEPDAYDAGDRHFLEAIAAQLAGSFERYGATLPAAREERPATAGEHAPAAGALAGIAAALGAISAAMAEEQQPEQVFALILREGMAVIPHDQAAIALFEDGMVRIVAAAGTTLAPLLLEPEHQQIWRAYRTLHVSSEHDGAEPGPRLAGTGIHSLLSIPILVSGAVVGRLTFATAQPRRFTAYHAQIGTVLAERAAQVVRTAQLQSAHEAARAKVAQLDALRRDFVATVSHELRTPLTGILGYMELLLNRWSSLDDERRRSMLQRAQSSAVRLEHLVTDLLLFSNVEHQELKLNIAGYPLAALVEQAAEDMRTKYRGQAITLRPPPRGAMVRADAQRVIQVLANLLDNAIKYSSEGTPVLVRWAVRGQEVHVAVRDYGPGIKEEDVPRLFTRFGTLGHQPRPGQVGTGIGLYICKKLLEAMGGRIWITSHPGRGSIFHFTLPSASVTDNAGAR